MRTLANVATSFSLPDGTPVDTELAQTAISTKLLVPCDDGLLPGFSQSYVMHDDLEVKIRL